MLLIVAKGGAEIGDWMQLIIILLIIGGSTFGAIAKKLIAAYSPKDREDSTKGLPTSPRARPVTPPVARKVSPSGPPRRQPPVDRGDLPPILAEIMEEVSGQRLERARPQRQAASREARPRRVRSRPPQPPRRAVEPAVVDSVAARKRLRHLYSAVEDAEKRVEADVERKLGRLRSAFDTEMPTAPRAAGAFSMPTSMARLGVRELRRAVVLSEILAPPLALRPSLDRL